MTHPHRAPERCAHSARFQNTERAMPHGRASLAAGAAFSSAAPGLTSIATGIGPSSVAALRIADARAVHGAPARRLPPDLLQCINRLVQVCSMYSLRRVQMRTYRGIGSPSPGDAPAIAPARSLRSRSFVQRLDGHDHVAPRLGSWADERHERSPNARGGAGRRSRVGSRPEARAGCAWLGDRQACARAGWRR